MVIERRPSRHPRRGPSCLLVLGVILALAAGAFVITNADDVRQTLTPPPTPEPTRSAATYAARAALYERDGDLEQAAASYEAAIGLDGSQIEFYTPLVRLLIALQKPDEALAWAEKAALLNPESDEVLALWAAAYLAQGDRLSETGQNTEADLAWAEAVSKAREATKINPNNAVAYAYVAQGQVLLGPERFEAANEAISLAQALEPDNPIVRRSMATVLENQGFYGQAIEQYQFALDLDPNNADLLIGLARNLWATGNIPEAILTFEDALEVKPDSADAFDGLGYMYFLIGEYPKAEENFAEAVKMDPELVRAHAHLGAARFRQLNYDGETGAIPELEQAVQEYRAVTAANAIYFNMLGLSYFYTGGECAEAQPLFEEVLAVVPDEPNAQYGLDLCHQAELSAP